MEYKDPMIELLSNLEQIVFKDRPQMMALSDKPNAFSEFEQLRKSTGLKIDDFARAMVVSFSMVHEW
jgi:putative transcriptional regulator